MFVSIHNFQGSAAAAISFDQMILGVLVVPGWNLFAVQFEINAVQTKHFVMHMEDLPCTENLTETIATK